MNRDEIKKPRPSSGWDDDRRGMIGGTEPARKSLTSVAKICVIKKPQPISYAGWGSMLQTFALICYALRVGFDITYYERPTDGSMIQDIFLFVKRPSAIIFTFNAVAKCVPERCAISRIYGN